MFKIGDYVAHYKDGICEVVEIGPLNISQDKNKNYYTLRPVFNPAGKLYTPVENEKRQIREVSTKDEAENLLAEMSQIEVIHVPDERRREACYKEALYKNDCREWAAIIKTTYLRKKIRLNMGKRSINVDEKYQASAEKFLCGELSVALNMKKEDIKQCLIDKINE